MRKKELNDKYTAIGLDSSSYNDFLKSYLKNNNEDEVIKLTILNGDGFTRGNIIQCATIDEWINNVDVSIKGEPFRYTEALQHSKNALNITKYKNYDQFKGINRTTDVGEIEHLFGSAPKEPFVCAIMNKKEYDMRTKDSYISPIESFNSVWTFLHKPKYILILKK